MRSFGVCGHRDLGVGQSAGKRKVWPRGITATAGAAEIGLQAVDFWRAWNLVGDSMAGKDSLYMF